MSDASGMADAQQWTAFEYAIAHHQVTTPERERKFAAEVKSRAEQGWRIHTLDTSSHPDIDILWHRPSSHGGALDKAQARVQELEQELSRVTAERDSLRTALSQHGYAAP
jgi:hypothetical protein